jgi:[FeFe] hydrogenase H-cluster maturation GTPase HydF
MSMEDTPRSSRLHIGIFGRTNSGKSSLLNALTNQQFAVVSDIAGTTTDPVYKTMEIHGIGPVVFIDTAGFDDKSELGKQRIEKTEDAASKTDVALVVFAPDIDRTASQGDFAEELSWIAQLQLKKLPFICVLNKCDTISQEQQQLLSSQIESATKEAPVCVSAEKKQGMDRIKEALIRKIPADFMERTFTGSLCKEGDLVLLVMPQDIQAPKGRLILPQVQILRELLDKKCMVMSCTTDKLDATLATLKAAPHLIITDSQVYKLVFDKKPAGSLLTSFSTLLAATKGDIQQYVDGAAAIDSLTEKSRVLIAEACTHAPLTEDIGREKIPRWLRAKAGTGLQIDMVSGSDFPDDLSKYNLIIQCGACMFNRAYVLNRQQRAKEAGVPMTNYGIAIAHLNGILDKVAIPK